LRDAGHAPVYFNQIERQVNLHDSAYLERRATVRRFLGHLGINIPKSRTGTPHHNAPKIYPAIVRLVQQGVISAEREEQREDGMPSRIRYQLVDPSPTLEV